MVVDLAKDINETLIIAAIGTGLDGKIERKSSLNGIFKAIMRKLPYAIISIDHTEENAR